MKISTTTQYDKFAPDVANRDVRKLKKLTASMKKYGYLSAYPILCVPNGHGKLSVKDGQHRLETAKLLKLPVSFVVESDELKLSIPEINNAQMPWTLRDYLSSYCKQGRSEYLEVKKYCERTGVDLSAAVSMFSGEMASGGNQRDAFKTGSFRIKDRSLPEKVGQLILFLGGITKHNTHKNLVAAICRACCVREFKPEVFQAKLDGEPSLLKREATLDGYTQMIENVYNYRAKNPIPLKFLCEQEMRKRTFAINGKPTKSKA